MMVDGLVSKKKKRRMMSVGVETEVVEEKVPEATGRGLRAKGQTETRRMKRRWKTGKGTKRRWKSR